MVNSVGLFERFLQVTDGQPEDLLFTNVKWGKGRKLVDLRTPVSNDTALKCLREALTRSDSPGDTFTLHSLKTGSVSEARNSGWCTVTEVNRQARWAMKDMSDRYHSLSLEAKLRASSALDINCPDFIV